MAYLEQENPKLIEDLLQRKEFYWIKRWDNKSEIFDDIIPKYVLDDAISNNNYLRLLGHQLFVRNFINPNTPYKRLHIKWSTGSGKSIGGLSIAMKFMQIYKMENQMKNAEIGSVFIIGFSERVFKHELLRFPEFGFISRDERSELLRLKKIALNSPNDLEKYQDFATKIRRRFTNRKKNGFFKFYGYKGFVNKIFVLPEGMNISELNEDEIKLHLKNNVIQFNKELLASFKNSIIICDEIHNVYNTVEKNNWGVALQAILDKEPSLRFVSMSATPFNNSPTEVIDLLNLLIPNANLQKEDFFNDKKLKPGALEKIAELSRGRFSFLVDLNPKSYPKLINEGESIKGIPYLKFTKCNMSPLQHATYKKTYTGTLNQDSKHIVDLVIENPEDPEIGLYKNEDFKKLVFADKKWKNKYMIDYINGKLTGDFMLYNNIGLYGPKYKRMLEEIHSCIKEDKGKIFIYSNIVHASGVLFIEELLIRNGFLDEYGSVSSNTICKVCGLTYSKHSKKGGVNNFIDKSTENLTDTTTDTATENSKENFIKNTKAYSSIGNDYINIISYIDSHPSKVNCADFISDKITILNLTEEEKNYMVLCLDKNNFIEISRNELLKDNPEDKLGNVSQDKLGNVSQDKLENDSEVILKHSYIHIPENLNEKIKAKKDLMEILEKEDYDKLLDIANEILDKTNSYILKKKYVGGGEHEFIPARFIMAHSEIEKNVMENSLEKYNNIENVNGDKILILVGSRIIKESYDIKAIQNLFIMDRPNNIPTLIQIRGRAVRKNSHLGLPPEKQIVRFKIFVSSIPELSYEEEKYKQKVEDFIVIQNIEKTLHENAIDSFINYEKINKYRKEVKDELGELPYEPKFGHDYSADKLNTSTYNIYYAKEEIEIIKVIIKRLFIEYSTVWEHNDLINAVKTPPLHYDIEVNTELITENNFLIAISQLLWYKNENYVTPDIKYTEQDSIINITDRVFNSYSKILELPDGQKSIIIPTIDNNEQFYILVPFLEEPIIDYEVPYRIMKQNTQSSININSFVQTKQVKFDYSEKKIIFYKKYVNTNIENMQNVICDYGSSFHNKFLEECIEYVFNIWTDPQIEKSEYHNFYFKMLYYYDLLSLVMWVHTSKNKISKFYTNYAIPIKSSDIKLKALSKYENRKDVDDTDMLSSSDDVASSGVINLLKYTYNRTSNTWIPQEFRENFNRIINKSLDLFVGRKKKVKSLIKVSADLLPIGHYISKFPRIYHPEKGWDENPTYLQNDQDFKENNYIIGFDERSDTGIHIRFKIRNPIHNIKKYKDSRETEKGTVCKSKSKEFLFDVIKKLNIDIPDKINVDELCVLIRSKLIRMEIIERVRKSDIKYFYFHYESRPETV